MGDADVYTLRDGKTVRVQGEHRLRQVDMVLAWRSRVRAEASFGSGSQIYAAAGVLYVRVVRHCVAGGSGAEWHVRVGSTRGGRAGRGRRAHVAGNGAGHWRKDECPTNRGRGQPRCDVRDCSFHGVLSCYGSPTWLYGFIVAVPRAGVVTADIRSNLPLD